MENSSQIMLKLSQQKSSLLTLVNLYVESNSGEGLAGKLTRICDNNGEIKNLIQKKLLLSEERIAYLNSEYFYLVPQFYSCIECNDDEKAMSILTRILEINESFSKLVKELIIKDLDKSALESKFLKILEINPEDDFFDILVTSIESSYHLHAFPRLDTFEIFVKEDAGMLYQGFGNVILTTSNGEIEINDVFEKIKKDYLTQTRHFILPQVKRSKSQEQEGTIETAKQILAACKIKTPVPKPIDGTGLTVLTGQETTSAQNLALQDKGHAIHKVILDKYNPESSAVCFSIIDNQPSPILVITTPLAANEKERNANFDDAFAAIKKALAVDNLNNYHIIAPLVGEGVTEGHITTFYKAPGAKPTIFDPKIGDIDAFITSPNTVIGTRKFSLGKAVRGLFRALVNGNFEQRDVTSGVSENLSSIDYVSLGTQSFFDGYTCGFHHMSNSLNIISLIQEGDDVDRQHILDKNAASNPVSQSVALLNKAGAKVNNSYGDFIKKAWEETFLPDMSSEQRKNTGFTEYFLGWPAKNGIGSKIAYVVLLGWLFTPVKNSIKLSTEFLLKATSESINYLKHKLYETSATSVAGQVVRSIGLLALNGLHAIAEGARLLIRTITSPIVSAKAGWKIHPVLGVLSGVSSAIAYVGLGLVAAPAIIAVGVKLGIIAGLNAISSVPVLSNIAYPLVWLLGKLGVSVTPALVGAAVLSTAAVAATAVNGTREGLTVLPGASDSKMQVEHRVSSIKAKKPESPNRSDFEDDWDLGISSSSSPTKQNESVDDTSEENPEAGEKFTQLF
jgi:hypothetical protein